MPGRFILLSDKHFPLNGAPGWWHLASISYGTREFMFFRDNITGKTYIEEVTGGTLEMIQDNSLWNALTKFVHDNKLDLIQSNKRRI